MLKSIRLHLKIKEDNSYTLLVGSSLYSQLFEFLSNHAFSHIGIVTDSKVRKLYGNSLLEAIRKKGMNASLFSFPSGEDQKSRRTKESIEDSLIKAGFKRDSLLISLGGGVVGDICGFVASTFMRGIPYIHIPTTLLSMVDSSIGGKTGINTPLGKNLIGTFYQPKAVFIDVNFLKSLDRLEMVNGISEMIKHAIIADPDYFTYLSSHMDSIFDKREEFLVTSIAWSCTIKKRIVEEDEKEKSIRKLLNFGHTIGHAIESSMHYRIKHGQAVALGMIAETHISLLLHLISPREAEKIFSTISLLGKLPSIRPSTSQILTRTSFDKKNKGDTVLYVLPTAIGKMKIDVSVSSSVVSLALGEL